MNLEFNSKLQNWLYNEKRTIEEGCLLLLQMENNRIHYDNLMRYPDKGKVMKYLRSELAARLKARLAVATKNEVAGMVAQVQKIEEKHFSRREGTTDEEFRKGKRADHDKLPEEIQALYVENMPLMQRMREVHLQLRKLSTENVSCPDSERYPFLKEMIALDKQIHENWYRYDHYVIEERRSSSEEAPEVGSAGNIGPSEADSDTADVSSEQTPAADGAASMPESVQQAKGKCAAKRGAKAAAKATAKGKAKGKTKNA